MARANLIACTVLLRFQILACVLHRMASHCMLANEMIPNGSTTGESNGNSFMKFLEDNSAVYFEQLDLIGEIKFTRVAAKFICEEATNKDIWILGIDVGTVDKDGNYFEDFNEGWLSRENGGSPTSRQLLKKKIASLKEIEENNCSAYLSIDLVPEVFNSFIVTSIRVTCV